VQVLVVVLVGWWMARGGDDCSVKIRMCGSARARGSVTIDGDEPNQPIQKTTTSHTKIYNN
jgi:hypothetical protein